MKIFHILLLLPLTFAHPVSIPTLAMKPLVIRSEAQSSISNQSQNNIKPAAIRMAALDIKVEICIDADYARCQNGVAVPRGLDVVLSLIHKIVGGVLCLSRGIRDRVALVLISMIRYEALCAGHGVESTEDGGVIAMWRNTQVLPQRLVESISTRVPTVACT
ncbi:hypothetical protein BZA77DRAFT_293569 [Pyronema omphalodes]|nr:hypothetical protein BZA77DRAFT_293569 [Pyronema omphalodes]